MPTCAVSMRSVTYTLHAWRKVHARRNEDPSVLAALAACILQENLKIIRLVASGVAIPSITTTSVVGGATSTNAGLVQPMRHPMHA